MNSMLKDFSKEKFDILIQAGQSNSEGYGFGNVRDPYEVSDRVWYFNGDGTFQVAQEKVQKNGIQSNFSLSFARKYIEAGELGDDRKLLILRTAVGGTGFSDNRWKSTDDLYLRMMDMVKTVLALNPENRLKALLWHQGETDAMNQVTFDYYYAHIAELVNNVRTEFSVPRTVPLPQKGLLHCRKGLVGSMRISFQFTETNGQRFVKSLPTRPLPSRYSKCLRVSDCL